MKRLLLLLAISAAGTARASAALAASCIPTPTAAVHYVCDCQSGADSHCVAGNDANNGTSTSTPYQTWSKALATLNSASGNDQVLLCQGGKFSAPGGGTSVFNLSCSHTSPCYFGSYNPGNGSVGQPDLPASDYGFQFTNGGNATHNEGYVVDGLNIHGGTQEGFFIFNDANYITLCNLWVHGFGTNGLEMAGGNTPDSGSDQSNDHVTIQDSSFTDNTANGVLGADNDQIIQRCTFQNNGFGQNGLQTHNIYDGNDVGCSRVLIQNNDLYQNTFVSGQCISVSLVMHGIQDTVTVQYNRVHEDPGTATSGCYAIAIDNGYPGFSESFTNLIIRGNKIENMGDLGIGCSSCINPIIENNIITTGGSTTGISVPDRTEDNTPPNDVDANATGAKIRNNTIYLNGGTCISNSGGTGNVISNNVCQGTMTSGTFTGMDLPLSSSNYSVDYNIFYAPSAGTFHWANTSTFAAWKTATGFDSHSQQVNPLFASAGTTGSYNFAAASGSSPIVDGGSTSLGSSIDILGVTRPSGSSADIGAYEFVSGGGGGGGGASGKAASEFLLFLSRAATPRARRF